MRLWSLHPMSLDAKGLVALWREGLLAKSVLEGKTKGYRQHPQLQCFRAQSDPVAAINEYLHAVFQEARRRGYRFDGTKLDPPIQATPIRVALGQIRYEWKHLLSKLSQRNPERFRSLCGMEEPTPYPMMEIVPGEIESWEVVK